MEFISKRTINDIAIVSIKEIMDIVGKKRIELMMESVNLQAYEIIPDWVYDRKNAISRKNLFAIYRKYGPEYALSFKMGVIATVEEDEYKLVLPPDSKRPVASFAFPTCFAKIRWKSDMSYDGICVLIDDILPLFSPAPVPIGPRTDVCLEDFIKLAHSEALRIYKAVRGKHKTKACQEAVLLIEKESFQYVIIGDLSEETFFETKKQERSVPLKILKAAVLRRYGQEIGQGKISEILKK